MVPGSGGDANAADADDDATLLPAAEAGKEKNASLRTAQSQQQDQ